MKFAHSLKPVGALALVALFGAASASADPWKFGVMSDNQWTGTPDDGFNPNTVPVDIIKQFNAEFIAQGVKLVLDVGDSVDVGSNPNLDTTAVFRQDLYNAGIGFFPVRGNHEAGTPGSGTEWVRVFPQMFNGINNETPAYAFSVFNPDAVGQPFPAQAGQPFIVGANFSEPTTINTVNNAVSYSFDYNNTRFVLLDQFGNTGEENYVSTISAQQPWITQQLADPARPEHAFVFGHKNLLGGNHKDNLFGNHSGTDPGDADPSQWPAQNAFIHSLAMNNVHYYISGHDHHHYDSVVTSPDGSASVHQIISASDSSKFYAPHTPVSANDTPVSQDLYKIGCYIYTVDGPRVTVDYYGVPSGQVGGILPTAAPGAHATPTLTGDWQKLLTWGYSLNGLEFLVPEGTSYTVVADNTTKAVANGETGYHGTMMQILAGKNTSTAANNYGKAQVKAVNTGWSPAQEGLASDILTLWGMADLGTTQTAAYVLLMSFGKNAPREQLGNGGFGIATRDSNGDWVNAVSMTSADAAQFAKGPWKSNYPVGSYGVDASTKTAWAVIDYNGDFAVTTGIEPPPGHRK